VRPVCHSGGLRSRGHRRRVGDVAVLAGPPNSLDNWNAMIRSLCETCALMREVITPKGSRFLLCQLSKRDPAYLKYPPQPVVRCDGYREKEKIGEVLKQ
jgi:hypothetical protein